MLRCRGGPVPDPSHSIHPRKLINNLSSRLRLSSSPVAASREAERLRIKEATRGLRTHAEKIAWHLAELAAQRGEGRALP